MAKLMSFSLFLVVRHHSQSTNGSILVSVVLWAGSCSALYVSLATMLQWCFYKYRSLYGASNKPWKVCRTIICGQSEVDISRILYILTYFIRCKDLVKSTALVDREDEDDFESPRPRQRLGAFSQSDFAHRLSLSPEPEPCMQFSFHHDLTATPTSTSYCSECRGSLSTPLIPKGTCSASASEHCTETTKQNLNPEVVEIERSSDSGVGDPYKDDEASVSQRQTSKR